MKKIAVIGGGAAGFFAAINIAEKRPNYKVYLLEKSNQYLAKVKVSGGGRCNVTHACFEPKELSKNYPRGEKEMLGPFFQFASGDCFEWFANKGVELKIEEDGRVFPQSNSSQSIIDCFLEAAKKNKVHLQLKAELSELNLVNNQFDLILTNGEQITVDKVVVAIGGHPKISHYDFLDKIGHPIVPIVPSLFTFNLPKQGTDELMGIVAEAEVKIKGTNFLSYGPVLFTHWGMSGPAVLKLSAMAAKELHAKSYQFELLIDWQVDIEDIMSEARKSEANKKVMHYKGSGLAQRLWQFLVKKSGIGEGLNWADLNKSQMQSLQNQIQQDHYQANGKTTFKEEFVTCGGVDLNAIQLNRMESKLIPNLFFCGEVMNVDAFTGGFNFQAAWTSAWIVSESI